MQSFPVMPIPKRIIEAVEYVNLTPNRVELTKRRPAKVVCDMVEGGVAFFGFSDNGTRKGWAQFHIQDTGFVKGREYDVTLIESMLSDWPSITNPCSGCLVVTDERRVM